MNSRDKILEDIRRNEKAMDNTAPVTELPLRSTDQSSVLKTFITVANSIGTKIIQIKSLNEITDHLRPQISEGLRIVNTIPEMNGIGEYHVPERIIPHELENVEMAILKAVFGVAENSALWVTEEEMGTRVLPFICQHLIMVLNTNDIVPDMHHAYERTLNDDHGFATFIAGPSKTADIEQSLVLGAHGPRSLTIFLLTDHQN